MDWFFEQWLYKMGHPVFHVTRRLRCSGEATRRSQVRQEQKPDPTYAYPQAGFFRAPVDIEIDNSRQQARRACA